MGRGGSENFQKIIELIVYYVCNLYQIIRFVNLQFGASLYYYIIYYIPVLYTILLTTVMFVDWCLTNSCNVSLK